MKSEAENPVTDQSNTDTVTISRKEYERLQETEHLYNWVLEQLHVTRKKVFGSSSEKATEGVCEQLSLLFNEAEAVAQEESVSKAETMIARGCSFATISWSAFWKG